MSNVGPPSVGDESGMDDALARVAAIIEQHREQLEEIDRASEISFRLWLNKVVQDVAGVLGIGLAKAQAFVADVLTIAGNAGRTFVRTYRANYEKHRRIQPN